MQWKLLRCCAHILEAREAKLKDLQSGSTAAPAPPPLCQTLSPWARPLEAPTVCFRGMTDDGERQELLNEFSGGPKLGAGLARLLRLLPLGSRPSGQGWSWRLTLR